jgi:RNA polymerase sigma factor (sigma-70 family)
VRITALAAVLLPSGYVHDGGPSEDAMDENEVGELLSRVRGGDATAWATLTARYTGLLWSVSRGLRMSEPDAADAVQTTWLRLLENLDAVRDPQRLGGWLATTTRRECYAIRRRATRVRPGTPGPQDWDELVGDDGPVDGNLLRDERDAALWHAFNALKPQCQSLLRVLMTDPVPSYAEVSAALDMAIGSIGPTRRRCLECLRERLRAESGQLFDHPLHQDRDPAQPDRAQPDREQGGSWPGRENWPDRGERESHARTQRG